MLTVDFTVAKVRAQASFADLAPHLPDRFSVWSTDESAWVPGPASSAQQLTDWLDSATGLDVPVRAVLGFCGGASLAAALAARLATRGPAPMLVLFDPVTVGSRTMIDQTLDSMHRLGSFAVSDNGIDNDSEDGDLDQLAARLAQQYAHAAAVVGRERRIPAVIVDQLCQRVAANLRFLTLASVAWSAPRRAPDLVVLSREHTAPIEALTGSPAPTEPTGNSAPTDAVAGNPTAGDELTGSAAPSASHAAAPPAPDDPDGRVVRLPVAQNDLLADANAAAAVARLLAGVS